MDIQKHTSDISQYYTWSPYIDKLQLSLELSNETSNIPPKTAYIYWKSSLFRQPTYTSLFISSPPRVVG